jgi:hypothetical protein
MPPVEGAHVPSGSDIHQRQRYELALSLAAVD